MCGSITVLVLVLIEEEYDPECFVVPFRLPTIRRGSADVLERVGAA